MSAAADEMVDGRGRVRPHWRSILGALSGLSGPDLSDRALSLHRALEEDGIASLLPSEERVTAWRCDLLPMPIPAGEFAYLEAGLAQRGRLLQAVLKDVYGPRRLLAEGLLPAELVFNNAGFLRACRTTGPVPRPPMLSVLATDLQRGQDGQWRVAGDSIARMAGLAQALENRRLLARTMPELFRRVPLRPMRPFLEAWQLSLRHALPPGHEEDAIALLTPAVGDPSWAENVVLTQALDCIPVEPGDLTVRRGRLYLKTLRGLQPIGALLRRMQGHLLDPLESDGPAAGGVVGLMDAARNGAVRIVNDPGADMAEAPALAAFLPRLCELLLDEALRLPGLRTLWLGDPAALEEVRAAPERWMLRSATDPRSPAVLLDLSNQALLARLEARPEGWAATEISPPSQAPCWVSDAGEDGTGAKVPLPVRLRMFLAGDDAGGAPFWRVLPGGFAHILEDGAHAFTRVPEGGLSKDVWVLEDEAEAGLLPALQSPPLALRRMAAGMPSRAGDNLFWLGRYVERLDTAARLSRAALVRLERDALLPHELAELHTLARCLVPAGLVKVEDFPVAGDAGPLRRALLRAARPDEALSRAFGRIARLVEATRDRQTGDMHDAFLQPLREMRDKLPQVRDLQALSRLHRAAMRYAAGVAGVAAENMVRGGAHTFLDLGRRVERAQSIASALSMALDQPPARLEAGLRLALELCDSVITYRTRYLAAPQAEPVLRLVLADAGNPRGLGFQFARARELLESLAGLDDSLAGEAEALWQETFAIAEGPAVVVPARLRGVEERAGNLAEGISRQYFTLLPQARSLVPVIGRGMA
ncbi:Hypothetical protein HVPorG_02211 [Roseomonas mucosa]|uniref:circularly permuted type 2 ATP-grasp protein n=1 Tax=Roseomonas mucosa TaxID=207340 RepID=UPI0021FDE373|nr:circularly permuted type 2 ATP-grasp protein [Roseomonas mucosa]QDJ10181.1 Hypothetical protein HVPorG_02211 [Roseomonas mucosa]